MSGEMCVSLLGVNASITLNMSELNAGWELSPTPAGWVGWVRGAQSRSEQFVFPPSSKLPTLRAVPPPTRSAICPSSATAPRPPAPPTSTCRMGTAVSTAPATATGGTASLPSCSASSSTGEVAAPGTALGTAGGGMQGGGSDQDLYSAGCSLRNWDAAGDCYDPTL